MLYFPFRKPKTLFVPEDKVQRNILEGFAQNISNSRVRMKQTRKNENGLTIMISTSMVS